MKLQKSNEQNEDLIQIVLVLKIEDGYPPVATERIWCSRVDENSAIVDSVPFYAYGISLGDKIEYKEEDGEFRFLRVQSPTRNCTFRLHGTSDSVDQMMALLRTSGFDCERHINLLAVNVPVEQMASFRGQIEQPFRNGLIEYEEATLRS